MLDVNAIITDAEIGDDFDIRKGIDPARIEDACNGNAADAGCGFRIDLRAAIAFDRNDIELLPEPFEDTRVYLPGTRTAMRLSDMDLSS